MWAGPEEARGGSTIWNPHPPIMLPSRPPAPRQRLASLRVDGKNWQDRNTRRELHREFSLWAFSSHLYSLYAHTESQWAGDLWIPEGAERVTGYGSPNVRRRRRAAELRRLRERAGFIGEEVARRLEWSTSKISRLERGQSGVKRTDLRRLLELYRVDPRRREELLALAEESQPSSRLSAVSAGLPEEHAQFLSVEAEAASVWNWEPQVVPGLLQIEEYARAIMLAWRSMFRLQPGEIDSRIEARR